MFTFCFINNNFLFNVYPFVIVQTFSFIPSLLPSFLNLIREDLMSKKHGYVDDVLIFLWFFLCCPIANDMQFFSPSHCADTSARLIFLSID
jgi:hypothetical protein